MSDPDTLHYRRRALLANAALMVPACTIGTAILLSGSATLPQTLAGAVALLGCGWLLVRCLVLAAGDGIAARIDGDALVVRGLFGTTTIPLAEVAGSLHITAIRRTPQLAIAVRPPRKRRPVLMWSQLDRHEIDGWRARLDARVGGPAPFTLAGTSA